MIPEFPHFKKLELRDRVDIEAITNKYPPYSDFNFISMWCWDTKGEMRVSQLHGNLVLKLNDYVTDKLFYSFLGNKNTDETAMKIISLSAKENLGQELRLVPEISAVSLDGQGFSKIEDRNNFDYVYNTDSLSVYKNGEYSTKRNLVNRLLKKYTGIESRIIDLTDKNNEVVILSLSQTWENNKSTKQKSIDFKNEEIAIRRLFALDQMDSLFCVGVYLENKLVAFSINETLSSEYGLSHFAKADDLSAGLYAYLMRETAKEMVARGKVLLDYEQDLGIPELRYSKISFRPKEYLKKYLITPTKDLPIY